jgi:hypothetical protein
MGYVEACSEPRVPCEEGKETSYITLISLECTSTMYHVHL